MYSPRHARPSCLPTRAAVTGGLTAVLLPIALAAPALAQESVAPATSDTSTATTAPAQPVEKRRTTMRMSTTPTAADGHARIGVRLLADDRGISDRVAVEAYTGSAWTRIATVVTDEAGLAVVRLPFSRDTRVRARAGATATRTEGVTPEAVVHHRTPTTVRVTPGLIGGDGKAPVSVRVVNAAGAAVRGATVVLQGLGADGTWKVQANLVTDDAGQVTARLPFVRDTRVRAVFNGTLKNLPRISTEGIVRRYTLGEQAVRIAAQQAGKPYRYGATGPNSFDCSGFTTYIYKTRLGRNIPRTSAQQAAAIPRVAQSAKRPGDLLFFRTGGRVTHVGVYAGGNKMWAAPTTGDVVKYQTIYTSAYTVGRVG